MNQFHESTGSQLPMLTVCINAKLSLKKTRMKFVLWDSNRFSEDFRTIATWFSSTRRFKLSLISSDRSYTVTWFEPSNSRKVNWNISGWLFPTTGVEEKALDWGLNIWKFLSTLRNRQTIYPEGPSWWRGNNLNNNLNFSKNLTLF